MPCGGTISSDIYVYLLDLARDLGGLGGNIGEQKTQKSRFIVRQILL